MNVTQELLDSLRFLRANRDEIIRRAQNGDLAAHSAIMAHKMWVTLKIISFQSQVVDATNKLRASW